MLISSLIRYCLLLSIAGAVAIPEVNTSVQVSEASIYPRQAWQIISPIVGAIGAIVAEQHRKKAEKAVGFPVSYWEKYRGASQKYLGPNLSKTGVKWAYGLTTNDIFECADNWGKNEKGLWCVNAVAYCLATKPEVIKRAGSNLGVATVVNVRERYCTSLK